MTEHTQDSPKVNVFFAPSKQVCWPFFFAKRTMTGCAYLDMLEEFLMPRLQEEGPNDIVFHQDGVPPHFLNEVHAFLEERFPGKWIRRGGPITRPPHSLDPMPLNFSCGDI